MPFDVIDQEGKIVELEQEEQTIRAMICYNFFDPKDNKVVDLVWGKHKTLENYLDGLPDNQIWHVYIGTEEQPRHEWRNVTLQPGDKFLLSSKPAGPLFALIPVLVASATGLGAATATVIAISTVIEGVISIGVGLALGAITNAIMGSPSQPQSSKTGANYSITGPFNTAQEGTMVPVVYGEFRMAGNVVNNYVDNGNNAASQVLYVMYVVCEGEVDSISDLQINYQPIENFVRATWDWRAGTVGQAPMNWFADTITPISVQEHITWTSQGVSIYTTSQAIDQFRLDFQFPDGLYSVDSKGSLTPAFCGIHAHYRLNNMDGTVGPWVYMAMGPTWFAVQYTPISLQYPNIYNTNCYCTGLRITVEVDGSNVQQTTDYDIQVQWRSSNTVPTNTSFIGQNPPVQWRVYGTTSPSDGSWVTMGSEQGSFANNPIVNADGTLSYSPGKIQRTYEVNNLGISTFDFTVTGATILQLEVYTVVDLGFDTNYKGTWNLSLPSPPLQHGFYDIEVWRTHPESTSTLLCDTLWLMNVNEIVDNPINYNNTAYYGLQISLGGQLTSEPNVTALVRGRKINIYDRNGGIEAYQWSNNPADIALDLLLNNRHHFAIFGNEIDFPAFDNLRQYDYANNLVFNGCFDGQTTVWDALIQVLRVGHAGPVMSGLKWSVVIEGPADPVQLFTQDNIIKGSFQSEFTGRKNRANQIGVQYWDRDDFYKQKTAFAFDPTIASQDAVVQSTFQGIGINNYSQAQAEAQFQLNLNTYINQSCTFDVFLQAMACSVGQVVLVQHDMPAWGYSAAIKSVIGNSIVIDSPVPVNGQADWRMLLTQSVHVFACTTIAQVSGAQIVCSPTMTNPVAPPNYPNLWTAAPLGGIGNWQNEISLSNGVGRILVTDSASNTNEYNVFDQQIINGALVMTLDRTVDGVAGNTIYLIKTDHLLEAAVTLSQPTDQFDQTLTITGWVTDQGSPQPGDRVLIGENTVYKKPFRITNITYKTDHVRTIKAMEYNASVYTNYPAPPPNSSTLPTTMLQVINLVVQQTEITLTGGAFQYYANVSWQAPLNSPFGYGGAVVFVEINNGDMQAFASIQSPSISCQIPLNNGDTAIIKVVAFGTGGQSADPATAPVVAITIGNSTTQPTQPDPSSFTAVGGIRQISLSWNMPSDDFIATAEIWANSTGDLISAYLQYSADVNYYVQGGLDPNETVFYWLRTKSIAGTYSDWIGPISATTSLLITDDLEDSIITAAKFAQSLAPVGLLASGSPNPTSPGDIGGAQMYFNEVDGQLYRWDGKEFAATVPAVNISGQLTQAQIAALAIGPAQLAAGAVLTQNLAVGNPTNIIWNSCWTLTTAGWSQSTNTGSPIFAASNPPGLSVPGIGSGQFGINGTINTGGYYVIGWDPSATGVGMAVVGGQVYGAGALLIPSAGTQAVVTIYWFDANGHYISGAVGNPVPYQIVGPANALSSYRLSYVIATAPANAASAVCYITGQVTAANASTPNFLFTQAQFGQMPPNATQLSPWAPGGVTNINGGCIQASSIAATQIAAGAITAGKIAANAVTAGTIQAGAINANEIAAGTIHATMLASDFQLTQNAQIGTAVINTLQLVGDSVTSFANFNSLNLYTGNGTNGSVGSYFNAATLTVPVPYLNSQNTTQTRSALLLLTAQQGLHGNQVQNGNESFGFSITQDGNTIWSREVQLYVDYPIIALSVNITSPGSTFQVSWAGAVGVSMGNINLTVFGRIA